MRILSLERTSRGFVLHVEEGSRRIYVRRAERRGVEAVFRTLGAVVVDEFGARIDQSQFEKEADPSFNRRVGPGFGGFIVEAVTPNWYRRWRYRRYMRQSSDNA